MLLILIMIPILIAAAILSMIVRKGYYSILGHESLVADLAALEIAFPEAHANSLRGNFSQRDVMKYYALTTQRDYKWLRFLFGPAMHTRLKGKFPGRSTWILSDITQQILMISNQIHRARARHVLEIGSGCGYCTLAIASVSPEITITGIDPLPQHVFESRKSSHLANIPNVNFINATATDLAQYFAEGSLDTIFGCESLCYLSTPQSRISFLTQAHAVLGDDGIVVLVDGFRVRGTTTDNNVHDEQCMKLCEGGFRIRDMPSVHDWQEAASHCGFHIQVNHNLTSQALPFWTLGWRLTRCILPFSRMLSRLVTSRARFESAANFISVTTTAQSLHLGHASYGMLVLAKNRE